MLNSHLAASWYEDSENWPPRVTLTEPMECILTDELLPEGRGGVLIRVEPTETGDSRLLVDYGSCGILSLSPDQTDFVNEYENYTNGVRTKQFPNWTMMLGRAFVRVESGAIHAIKLKELLAYESMLIIYASDFNDLALAELLSLSEDSFFSNTLFVLFPGGQASSDQTKSVVIFSGQHLLSFHYVYPYLSCAFQKSLAHETLDLPSAVLVDMEGKTLIPPAPVAAMKEMMQRELLEPNVG
jgi:hypothetical protein